MQWTSIEELRKKLEGLPKSTLNIKCVEAPVSGIIEDVVAGRLKFLDKFELVDYSSPEELVKYVYSGVNPIVVMRFDKYLLMGNYALQIIMNHLSSNHWQRVSVIDCLLEDTEVKAPSEALALALQLRVLELNNVRLRDNAYVAFVNDVLRLVIERRARLMASASPNEAIRWLIRICLDEKAREEFLGFAEKELRYIPGRRVRRMMERVNCMQLVGKVAEAIASNNPALRKIVSDLFPSSRPKENEATEIVIEVPIQGPVPIVAEPKSMEKPIDLTKQPQESFRVPKEPEVRPQPKPQQLPVESEGVKKLVELGFRPEDAVLVWNKWRRDAQALIFAADANELGEVEEIREILINRLENERARGTGLRVIELAMTEEAIKALRKMVAAGYLANKPIYSIMSKLTWALSHIPTEDLDAFVRELYEGVRNKDPRRIGDAASMLASILARVTGT